MAKKNVMQQKLYCRRCLCAAESLNKAGLCPDCVAKEEERLMELSETPLEQLLNKRPKVSPYSDTCLMNMATNSKLMWEETGNQYCYEQYKQYMNMLGKTVPPFNANSKEDNGTKRKFTQTITYTQAGEGNHSRYIPTVIPAISNSTRNMNNMSGDEFESFCADILRKKGYSDVRITPSSGDQGVDITCSKDFIKYAIQCKRYNAPLGNTPIQEVFAGKMFYGCDVAIVMTNSTFTDAAIALAKATGVILWDRSVLNKMMKDIS